MIKTRAKVLNQLKTVKSFARACGFVLSFLSTIFVFVSVSFADPNIAASSNSATCKNSTLETYSGTSNLSANWNANTINLHWYADDTATTELTGSGIPTSCVYDGALTPPPVASIPQKTGYTFAGWKVRGLPDGYTKLQYIQSSGTQYIDTGVVPNLQYAMEVKGSDFYGKSAQIVVSTTTDSSMFRVAKFTATQKVGVSIGAAQSLTANIDGVDEFVVKLNIDKKLYINNQLIGTVDTSGYDQNVMGNILLFSGKYKGGAQYYGIGKIYYVKFWDNGALVRNMIPAKNSNNVVGMYDLVTKTFFTNAGTGSFTAGPVVQ